MTFHPRAPGDRFRSTWALAAHILTTLIACTMVSTAGAAVFSSKNLLQSSHFEPGVVVGPFFPPIGNGWRAEAATLATTSVGAIAPQSPPVPGMLHVTPGSGTISQVQQTVDVSAFATQIDAGNMYVTAATDVNCPTSACNVSMGIGDGTTLGLFANGSLPLSPIDANAATWERIHLGETTSIPIPVGTRSIFVEVGFENSSIPSGGFVDAVGISITDIAPSQTVLTVLEEANLHAMLEATADTYFAIQQEFGTDIDSTIDWTGTYDENGWSSSVTGTLYGDPLSINFSGTGVTLPGGEYEIAITGSGAVFEPGNTQAIGMSATGTWFEGSSGFFETFEYESTGSIDTPALKWWKKAIEAVGGFIVGGALGSDDFNGMNGLKGAKAGIELSKAFTNQTISTTGTPPDPTDPGWPTAPIVGNFPSVAYGPIASDEISTSVLSDGSLRARVANGVELNGTFSTGTVSGTGRSLKGAPQLQIQARGNVTDGTTLGIANGTDFAFDFDHDLGAVLQPSVPGDFTVYDPWCPSDWGVPGPFNPIPDPFPFPPLPIPDKDPWDWSSGYEMTGNTATGIVRVIVELDGIKGDTGKSPKGTKVQSTIQFEPNSFSEDNLFTVPWQSPTKFMGGTFEVIEPGDVVVMTGDITTLNAIPVPEPAVPLMLMIGAGGLATIRRLRSRERRSRTIRFGHDLVVLVLTAIAASLTSPLESNAGVNTVTDNEYCIWGQPTGTDWSWEIGNPVLLYEDVDGVPSTGTTEDVRDAFVHSINWAARNSGTVFPFAEPMDTLTNCTPWGVPFRVRALSQFDSTLYVGPSGGTLSPVIPGLINVGVEFNPIIWIPAPEPGFVAMAAPGALALAAMSGRRRRRSIAS